MTMTRIALSLSVLLNLLYFRVIYQLGSIIPKAANSASRWMDAMSSLPTEGPAGMHAREMMGLHMIDLQSIRHIHGSFWTVFFMIVLVCAAVALPWLTRHYDIDLRLPFEARMRWVFCIDRPEQPVVFRERQQPPVVLVPGREYADNYVSAPAAPLPRPETAQPVPANDNTIITVNIDDSCPNCKDDRRVEQHNHTHTHTYQPGFPPHHIHGNNGGNRSRGGRKGMGDKARLPVSEKEVCCHPAGGQVNTAVHGNNQASAGGQTGTPVGHQQQPNNKNRINSNNGVPRR